MVGARLEECVHNERFRIFSYKKIVFLNSPAGKGGWEAKSGQIAKENSFEHSCQLAVVTQGYWKRPKKVRGRRSQQQLHCRKGMSKPKAGEACWPQMGTGSEPEMAKTGRCSCCWRRLQRRRWTTFPFQSTASLLQTKSAKDSRFGNHFSSGFETSGSRQDYASAVDAVVVEAAHGDRSRDH